VNDVIDQMKENANKLMHNLENGEELQRRAKEMESEVGLIVLRFG